MLALSHASLILASSSPRRLELLSHLGLPFVVHKPDFDELRHPGESPSAYVHRNAHGKALAIAADITRRTENRDCIIIAADTIVVLGSEVLEKPLNVKDAEAMLAKLSGKTHEVLTGLALLYLRCDGEIVTTKLQVVSSKVTFKELSLAEIKAYVATGEPMDKAGSYAVQGKGSYMVARIDGSYTNVIGLPLTETYQCLCDFSSHLK